MAFDFAKAKLNVRRVVHRTLAVVAFYKDDTLSEPVETKARWHNKIDRFGDPENMGLAEIIQGIDRIIFEAAEARRLGVKRGGTITFRDYGSGLGVSLGSPLGGSDVGPAEFTIGTMIKEPSSGAFEETWMVTRKETP